MRTLDKREVPRAPERAPPTHDFVTPPDAGDDRRLRRSAERLSVRVPSPRLLDLRCGTGESTEAMRMVFPDAILVGVDASPERLDVARSKESLREVCFVRGDANDPSAFLEGPFDGIFAAHSIRALGERALSSLVELLAPGGSIALHEFAVADRALPSWLWDVISWGVEVPGTLVAARGGGNDRARPRSLRALGGVEALEERLRTAGFCDVWAAPMDGWQRGIVHTLVGRRGE